MRQDDVAPRLTFRLLRLQQDLNSGLCLEQLRLHRIARRIEPSRPEISGDGQDVVVGDDGAERAQAYILDCCAERDCQLFPYRKKHLEGGPVSRLARHGDSATMAAHDSQYSRQAEAASCEPGGKERVEHLRLRGLIHAGAGVFHLERYVGSGGERSAGQVARMAVAFRSQAAADRD